MGWDGMEERAAIVARLEAKYGKDRIFRGVPDDAVHERFHSGKVKSYAAIAFGFPRELATGRTMASGQKDTPHILPGALSAFGSTSKMAEDLLAAMLGDLVDWAPSATSETITAVQGYETRPTAETKPTRWEQGAVIEAIVNM